MPSLAACAFLFRGQTSELVPVKCTGAWSLVPAVSFLLEPSCRGKGLGTEASLLMMSYGKTELTTRGLVSAEPSSGTREEAGGRQGQEG